MAGGREGERGGERGREGREGERGRGGEGERGLDWIGLDWIWGEWWIVWARCFRDAGGSIGYLGLRIPTSFSVGGGLGGGGGGIMGLVNIWSAGIGWKLYRVWSRHQLLFLLLLLSSWEVWILDTSAGNGRSQPTRTRTRIRWTWAIFSGGLGVLFGYGRVGGSLFFSGTIILEEILLCERALERSFVCVCVCVCEMKLLL